MESVDVHTESCSRDEAVTDKAPSVTVQDLKKSFTRTSFNPFTLLRKNTVDAVRGISFDLYPGEMVGLLGPNGAGKTTLLKMLSTLVYPSEGRIEFFGEDVRANPIAARAKLGFITCDERSFYWRLTGRANLEFFSRLYGLSTAEMRSQIASLLDALGLAYAADQRFDGYSAGMKQKLAIARGLLKNPQIVLYDEPTRSLDPLSQHDVRQLILENRKRYPDQTHLIATHNLVEAEQLCDRIMIVVGGRIVAQGTVDEIRDYFKEEHVSHVLVVNTPQPLDVESLSKLEGVQGVEIVSSSESTETLRVHSDSSGIGLSNVLSSIISDGARVLQTDTESLSLDEIFRVVSKTNMGRGEES